MKKFASRLSAVVVAAGLTFGVMAISSAPAQAGVDTSWGRGSIVAPVSPVETVSLSSIVAR